MVISSFHRRRWRIGRRLHGWMAILRITPHFECVAVLPDVETVSGILACKREAYRPFSTCHFPREVELFDDMAAPSL
jgi:hypothetical protein